VLKQLTEKKRMLYVQTSGVDTPERTYAPFILAATAAAMDIDATVYFLAKGVTVVKRGQADMVKLGSFPSLKQVMDRAVEAGVKFEVCEQSCELLGLDRGDFVEAVKIVGAATLNDRVLEADGVLCF